MIKLKGNYAGAIKQAELSKPNGAGDTYHITIDHYHQGSLMLIRGEWRVYLNDRSELTTADIQIFIDAIEQSTQEN